VVIDERRPRHVVAGAGAGHTHDDVILHAQRVRRSPLRCSLRPWDR
jgi:hypothetical protein